MTSIALVTELFFPSIGGQEFRFLKLATGLSKKGFKVTVYTTDHTGGTLPKEDKIDEVRVIGYVSFKNYVKPGSRSILQLSKYIIETRKIILELSKEYDYILVNQMPIFHLFYIPNNQKIVIDWCEVYKEGMLKYPLSLVAKRFTKGIAVSEVIADFIIKTNNLAKISIIRTPSDIEKYSSQTYKKDENLILYIGRLVPHKNVIALAYAVIRLNAIGNKVRFVIIGDGPLRNKLIKLSNEYKFIEVLGRVDEDTKIKLLKQAYLLAIPSTREGFPNVAAEAIASSTPILTIRSPLNNIYEFVEKFRIGFVAENASPEAIAKRLLTITQEEILLAVGITAAVAKR